MAGGTSKDEVEEALEKVMEEVAALSVEIRNLALLVGDYMRSIKETRDVVEGRIRHFEENVEFIQKAVLKARMRAEKAKLEAKRTFPVHFILKGEMKNYEVVEIMKELAKSQQTEELPNLIKDILKGRKKVSDFAVAVKKQLEAEGR